MEICAFSTCRCFPVFLCAAKTKVTLCLRAACYLSALRLMLNVGGGADLGLHILQVRQRLIDDLQLPLDRGWRFGWGSDHCHLLLLEDAEGLGRVAARGARARRAAGVARGRAGCDGGGARGGGATVD